ncbi:MAG: 5-(carboxyamino)imidazole ribonucleotide synthase [Akkermansiaceae bacterium]
MDHEPCIGVLGGGQLGRMLALDARRMGYRVMMWTGGDNSGAARFADIILLDSFDSESAFEKFTSTASVVTVEFENIPRDLINRVAERVPVMPSTRAVSICQNREREKMFLRENGIPTTAFEIVRDAVELAVALEKIPGDVILKTLEDGYDGKGQLLVKDDGERASAEVIWEEFGGGDAIVEQRIDLAAELSVICVGGQDGEVLTYDPAENEHVNHILDVSIVPARLSAKLQREVQEIARDVTVALGYVGVMGVEFFIDKAGKLLVNEMAPRPHNSGHHTIDACATSQFEQQLRAICGLPLGSTKLIQPVVMLNLLGDIWPAPKEAPDWSPIHEIPGAKLHLYGKAVARAGRKMGHVSFTAASVEEALEQANSVKKVYGME